MSMHSACWEITWASDKTDLGEGYQIQGAVLNKKHSILGNYKWGCEDEEAAGKKESA